MKVMRSVLFIMVIGLCICCNQKHIPGTFMVSGCIEATTVTLSSKVTGDVVAMGQREGTVVEAGGLVAQIDARDYELQRVQLAAQVTQAEAALQMAVKGARSEDRRQAEKGMEAARVSLDQAQADHNRIKTLRAKGSATEKQLDDAASLLEIRQAQYDAAVQAYQKVKSGLRQEEIDMARAAKEQAEAALAILDKRIQDCRIVAPLKAVLTEQLVEIGEMVTPGQNVYSLADLSVVKLRVYVPEKQLPYVKHDREVKVRIDGADKPFKGRVVYISEIAEFTPKTIQTQDERVKLVFAIDIELDNEKGLLKAGLPADAYFESAGSY
ncbi:HlyD family efflux transporter periplasmic adaptor subunit [bacterium]|nr:HlyD family efflux transporter periplasmic adaptor subunit [bacterium]